LVPSLKHLNKRAFYKDEKYKRRNNKMKFKISKNKKHQILMDHKEAILQKEKEGLSIAEIAQEYKVHLVTIYDFLRKCGIKRTTDGRFKSKFVMNKENIIRQYREEVPVREIAKNEDITMKTIYKYLKKWGARKEGDYRIYCGYDDEGKVKSKNLTFEQRVSPELLARMKENTRINKIYIKKYPWQEDRFIIETKKKILEGV
jgi:transposase